MLNDAPVLSLRPRFSVRAVEGEGAFLVSELEQFVLEGRLALALIPLLDGTRTQDDIIDILEHEFSMERILFGLRQLEERGYIYRHNGSEKISRPEAGYWDLFGLHSNSAIAQKPNSIAVTILGDVPAEESLAILQSFGAVTGEDDAAIQLVLTDDYLRPELAQFNARALEQGKSWMLAKPTGATLWIGPFFRGKEGPCWACLAQRIRLNQQVQSYVAGRERSGMVAGPLVMTTSSLSAGLALSTLMMAQAAAASAQDEKLRDGKLLTLNTCTWQLEHHAVTKRPQCEICGDGGLVTRSQERPPRLAPGPTPYREGGLRTRDPKQFMREYDRHVSTISGVVSKLERVQSVSDSFHTYYAGHNFGQNAHSLHMLRQGLRSQSGGKGETDDQARASALGEAIERYSGVYHGDEARRRGSFRELGSQAIHPNACMLFSEKQYREREKWNAMDTMVCAVPQPFDEERKIDWSPVWSITRGEWRYLPTSHLYYWYRPEERDPIYCWAESNGCAAGTSLEDAMLQGFCEIIERDSVALWWYNRIKRPAIDLSTFSNPFFQRTVEAYRKIKRDLWTLDITSDLGIPAVAAISRRIDGPPEDIVIAFGAHFDVDVAISRAITELNQFLPAALAARDQSKSHDADDALQRKWWETATIENQPYLVPLDGVVRTPADFASVEGQTLADFLERAKKLAEDQGSELLVLDQTRPDLGVPVVKVMVPGLRHFWARFAPGRLYDVPVRLGWQQTPTDEADLNPTPMFV